MHTAPKPLPTPPVIALDGRLGRPSAEELLVRWRETGDPACRAAAIEAYLPLARKLARRYRRGTESFDDLVQVACVGLVKAVDRFDPSMGHRFGSFAIPTITGELRRHFRDTTWSFHVPRGVQEDLLHVRRASDLLTDRLGRAPTVTELSEETALDAEQIVEALHAAAAKDPSSLQQPTAGDTTTATLADAIGCEEDGFDLVDHRATITPLLSRLRRRDREMLLLRFAFDMTQTEIAERMGCSQMQVSRLLRRTLDQLAAATRS